MDIESAVFFDIGNTLGAVHVEGFPPKLQTIRVYQYCREVLERLSGSGIRLGVISNTGSELREDLIRILGEAGVVDFFEPELFLFTSVEGVEKDSPDIFRRAINRASRQHSGVPDSLRCIYVGEDAQERCFAIEAGMLGCPHPLLVEELLAGESLYFAKLGARFVCDPVGWKSELAGVNGLVSLSGGTHRADEIFAIVSSSAIVILSNCLVEIQLLGPVDAPASSDLYLLRDDSARAAGFMSTEGQSVKLFRKRATSLWFAGNSAEGMLVAIPGGRSVEEVHFDHVAHGHHWKLTPSMRALQSLTSDGAGAAFAPAWASSLDTTGPIQLSNAEKNVLVGIDENAIQCVLDRYTGVAPLGQGIGRISSRHVQSPDNEIVVQQLVRDLQAIGGDDFDVRVHPFMHEGRQLFNVEARFPANRNSAQEEVLVTAHLDSTAASSPPYSPDSDPAPGADDDASGIAAVLCAAATLKELACEAEAVRAFRFVLFNAEEHGLVGSQSFARDMAELEVPIVAVLQMDMIGYNQNDPRSFEVHAGYWPSPDTQARSLQLASRLAEAQAMVSPNLESPQIYHSTGAEPANRDPAEGRSDHAPFHQHGFAACVISEDFFAGPTPAEANPNYHKETDDFVDLAYAADIARAVTATAWAIARD